MKIINTFVQCDTNLKTLVSQWLKLRCKDLQASYILDIVQFCNIFKYLHYRMKLNRKIAVFCDLWYSQNS